MESLLKTIMRRDKMSQRDAQSMIDDAKRRVAKGEDPEEILHDEFGLEPDYVFDLL